MLVGKQAIRFILIITLTFQLAACGEKKSEVGSGNAAKSKESEQQPSVDAALRGMVSSVVEQASKQGVQIDSAAHEALMVLIKVYLVRPDLHQAYGETFDVNLSALVQWAATAGSTVDANKNLLAPHVTALGNMANLMSNTPVRVKLEWR